jgi:hypothetical protein
MLNPWDKPFSTRMGVPFYICTITLMAPTDMKLNLFLKIATNTLRKLICFPTPSSMKSNTTLNSNEDSE